MIYPPPSFLTGLVTEVSNEIHSRIQENYGDNTTAYKFNINFKSLVQTWIEEFNEYGGTIWGVDQTGNRTTIFDQFKHGYNGIMKINEAEDLNSTRSIVLISGTEVIIAFQYSGDEADYLETGSSKFEQDYFNWVVVYKYFENKLEEILSYECA